MLVSIKSTKALSAICPGNPVGPFHPRLPTVRHADSKEVAPYIK